MVKQLFSSTNKEFWSNVIFSFLYYIFMVFKKAVYNGLTLKILGGGTGRGGSVWSLSPVVFSLWYYLKSNLSWKLPWIFSSHSEDLKTFSINISYFQQFGPNFWIFVIFLCYKETNDVTYNRWCQNFFTFNRL